MTTERQTAEFPRAHARTRRFSLGEPRPLLVSPDGTRVVFLRAPDSNDPATSLWVLDLASGHERCVLDPRTLGIDDEALTAEERARRERAREQATGVTAAACDEAARRAVCVLGTVAWLVDLVGDDPPRPLDVGGGAVVDPRLSPDGSQVAFVRDSALWVAATEPDAAPPRRLVGEDDPNVSWGLAEFVAAEEMGRGRGLWWSPDSTSIAVARVDTAAVRRWHVTDPAHPERPPSVLAYPAAGTPNAEVSLSVVDVAGTTRTDVSWDRSRFCYLARVSWAPHGPLTLLVQSRDQRHAAVLTVDGATGATTARSERTDSDWIELVDGVPCWSPDGRLVEVVDDRAADSRRVMVDDVAMTPPDLQVRAVLGTLNEDLVVTASGEDPTAIVVHRVPLDGSPTVPITPSDAVADAIVGGGTLVVSTRRLDADGVAVTAHGANGQVEIASHAAAPGLPTAPRMLRLGAHDLAAALLLPSWHRPGDPPLPILCDPYGGPHAQRVLRNRTAFATSQWFAEAGFAVLVVDGRGSPGRGPSWERAIAGDLASLALEDQVAAVEALTAARDDVDPGRVAIRGWSFGGYLAALAVLRRPDTFAAAVAGAPVTDWSLYDTHYTERYLGDPAESPGSYTISSIIDDAPQLTRPLQLIHGLADDNVVAAHTLRLSAALLAAGRPHEVLPLVGVTHMTPQEDVAASLLELQLDFLRRALGLPHDGRAG